MPPTRGNSAVKPVKYERSHEENQERAYIAASRRSDRCLEARIESARRASDLHEKRTGRALHITEADVLNEEMYEEINDLPSEYRRLTAHLQTQNAEFDRRLLAYLSSQVAMRSTFDQADSDRWLKNQFSNVNQINIDQFVNPSMLQDPPQYQHEQQHQQQQQATLGTALSAGTKKRSTNYRQSPYHIAPQDARSGQQARSLPTATSQECNLYHHQTQSPCINAFEAIRLDDTRSISSSAILMPQTPFSESSTLSRLRSPSTPSLSHANVATNQQKYHQQPALYSVNESEASRQFLRPIAQTPMEPISATFLSKSQQLFANTSSGSRIDKSSAFMTTPLPPSPANRHYSYNPNGKPEDYRNSSNHLRGMVPETDESCVQACSSSGLRLTPSEPSFFTGNCIDHQTTIIRLLYKSVSLGSLDCLILTDF